MGCLLNTSKMESMEPQERELVEALIDAEGNLSREMCIRDREVEAPVPAGDAEKIFLEVQQRGGSVAEAERAENVLKLYVGDKGGMEKVACQHDQNHQPQPQFYPQGVADGPGKPFFPDVYKRQLSTR